MATKRTWQKSQWISNVWKQLEGHEERPKAEIHINLLRRTLEKYQIRNQEAMMGYMNSGSKIHLHSWQTSTRNELMPTRSRRTQMDDQRKDDIDPKWPLKMNHFKQLQTYNMLNYDVKNGNCTNKGRYLRLAKKALIVCWGSERMPQRIQRNRRATLDRSAYLQRGQDKTQKSSSGLD